MALTVEIGGTDYGPAGENVVVASGLQMEVAGHNRVGTGRIVLKYPASAGYTILDKAVVKVYNPTGTDWVYLGGVVSHREYEYIPATNYIVLSLDVQDANIALDTVVRPAADAQDLDISAGTFADQVTDLVQGMQKDLTVTLPLIEIDTTSYVTNLTGATVLPAFTVKGQTLREALTQLCANAYAVDDTLRPRFYVALLPDGLGGSAFCLVVIDAANPPASAFTISDTPGVGEYGPVSLRRALDGSGLVNRKQAIYGDPAVQILSAQDSTSQSTYPNPFVNHGGTGNTGYWMAPPDKDTESASATEAQNLLDRKVASTAYPRETIEAEVDNIQARPGQVVTLDWSYAGLLTDYVIAGVSYSWVVENDTDYLRAAITLGQMPLLLGQSAEDDLLVPPVERDVVPPDPPSGFTLVSNVYNPATGMAELTFLWTASVAADVAGYRLVTTAEGRYTDAGDVTTYTLEWPAGTSYSVNVQAYDGARNYSVLTGPLTGTAAQRNVTRRVPPAFEDYPPTADGLRTWTVDAGIAANFTFDTSVAAFEGTMSLKFLNVPSATTRRLLSPQYVVQPGEILVGGGAAYVQEVVGPSVAPTVAMEARFYQADGTTQVGADLSFWSTASPPTSWPAARTQGKVTVPAGAYRMAISYEAAGGASGTYNVWFSPPTLERQIPTIRIADGAVTDATLDTLSDPLNFEIDVETDPWTWRKSDGTTIETITYGSGGGNAFIDYSLSGVRRILNGFTELGAALALPVAALTSNTTLATTHCIVEANANGGAFTITLPDVTATPANVVYIIKKTDSSANKVTIDGNGSQTIDGITTYPLSEQGQAVMLTIDQGRTTGWRVLAQAGLVLKSDGTRWLGTKQNASWQPGETTTAMPFSASADGFFTNMHYDLDVLLTRFDVSVLVNGTHNVSNYWTIELERYTGSTWTSVGVYATDKATNGFSRMSKVTADFSNSGVVPSTDHWLKIKVAKVGTPGNLSIVPRLEYRAIYT